MTATVGQEEGMMDAVRLERLKQDSVLKLLEREIRKVGSAKDFAKQHGLSSAFVCDVRRRRRGLSTKILNALGLYATVEYRRKVGS